MAKLLSEFIADNFEKLLVCFSECIVFIRVNIQNRQQRVVSTQNGYNNFGTG